MKEQLIQGILCAMLPALDNEQLTLLKHALERELEGKDVVSKEEIFEQQDEDYIGLFITSKRIEGCSEKTLCYYESTITKMHDYIGKRALLGPAPNNQP